MEPRRLAEKVLAAVMQEWEGGIAISKSMSTDHDGRPQFFGSHLHL
jgi:hypothetical protein